jgi:hypothetical protein
MGEHPEVILPTNLDVCCSCPEVLNNQGSEDVTITPIDSLKESKPSPSWIEIVRRGKNRSKNINISGNDKHILEY